MPDLDERIIDEVIADDPAKLAALAAELGGDDELRIRAERLGLTTEVIKRCRLSGTRPTRRDCIRCDGEFLSLGVQNRLCRRCAGRPAG